MIWSYHNLYSWNRITEKIRVLYLAEGWFIVFVENSFMLYVQVTVHRDNLRINNQQDASSIQNFILSRNSTCFWHLLCPSSGVISCTRGNWYVSCRLYGHCLLFCQETLNVSGIYSAHQQELSAVHVATGMRRAGYMAAVFYSVKKL